jgi:hypothetical protein
MALTINSCKFSLVSNPDMEDIALGLWLKGPPPAKLSKRVTAGAVGRNDVEISS